MVICYKSQDHTDHSRNTFAACDKSARDLNWETVTRSGAKAIRKY